MLIISDKGYNSYKHNYKCEQIIISNVHKHPASFLVQVGGQNIALPVPKVNILYFNVRMT